MLLRNVSNYLSVYLTSQSRRHIFMNTTVKTENLAMIFLKPSFIETHQFL